MQVVKNHMAHSASYNDRFCDIERPDARKIEEFFKSGRIEDSGKVLDEILASVNFDHINSMMLRLYIVMDIYMAARSFSREMGIAAEMFVERFGSAEELEARLCTVDETTSFLREIFSQCIRWRIETAREDSNSVVNNARNHIDNNYKDSELSLKSIADAVCITPAYLSALFKKETGKNLSEYITEVRINRAKELLCCTSKFVYEVAYDVGFRDYRYFSQIFKKYTGQTPRQFQVNANVCS